MRLFYFINIVGTDTGISGIPRLVRNFARRLQSLDKAEIIPVRWSHEQEAIVHAEQCLLDNLALHEGPSLVESAMVGQPIACDERFGPEDWLFIPEVPHFVSHDIRYAPIPIFAPLGYARGLGLSCAVVVHDILPLTFPEPGTDPRDQLAFMVYAQALINADIIFPVSVTTGEVLHRWLTRSGYRPKVIPPMVPVLPSEEMIGFAKRMPNTDALKSNSDPIEFVTVGWVCPRKNQVRTMYAFNRLVERHPELDLHLHLIGLVDGACAA